MLRNRSFERKEREPRLRCRDLGDMAMTLTQSILIQNEGGLEAAVVVPVVMPQEYVQLRAKFFKRPIFHSPRKEQNECQWLRR